MSVHDFEPEDDASGANQAHKIEDNGGGTQRKPRLTPLHLSEVVQLPRREALIAGLLDCAAMSIMFGASGTGKTFLTLDLAFHVARGQPWRGRVARQGAVLYIAPEGGHGLIDRLLAYQLHHKLEPESVPLHFVREPIDLCHGDKDAKLLIEHCAALSALRLIVVDTLARAMAGGNENAPDDMGRFVLHCDRLRLATGAHVLVLHHSGKDESKGSRGHSSLRAACDTEIETTTNEASRLHVATIVKQRDHATGDAFSFRLDVIRLPDGERTSCVVAADETPTAQEGTPKRAKLTNGAKIALRALSEAILKEGQDPPPSAPAPIGVKAVTIECWRQQAYRRGISTGEERAKQQAFKRSSEQLISLNRVGVWEELAWLPS